MNLHTRFDGIKIYPPPCVKRAQGSAAYFTQERRSICSLTQNGALVEGWAHQLLVLCMFCSFTRHQTFSQNLAEESGTERTE